MFVIKDHWHALEYTERQYAAARQLELRHALSWADRALALMTWQDPVVHESVLIRNNQFIQCTRRSTHAAEKKTVIFPLEQVEQVLLHEAVRITTVYYYVLLVTVDQQVFVFFKGFKAELPILLRVYAHLKKAIEK